MKYIPHRSSPDFFFQAFLTFAAIFLAGALIYVTYLTYNWPLRHDAAALHYLAHRIWQGDVPYAQTFTLDMPATLLINLLSIVLFGGGDIGHRTLAALWDYLVIVSAALLFGRKHAALAITGAICYVLYHISTGVDQMLQREYLMLPFLVLAGYFICSKNPRGAFLSGLMLGCAMLIKPLAIIYGIFLLAIMAGEKIIRARRMPCSDIARYAAAFCLGAASIAGLVLLWLWLAGGLGAFWDTVYHYFPVYQSMAASPQLGPTLAWMAPYMLVAGVLSIPLLAKGDVKCCILLAGCVYGLLHYFLQTFDWQHRLVPLRFFFVMLCFYAAGYYAETYGRTGRIGVAAMLSAFFIVVSPFYWTKPALLDAHKLLVEREQQIQEVLEAYKKVPAEFKEEQITMQPIDITAGIYYTALRLNTRTIVPCTCPPLFHFALDNPFAKQLESSCMDGLEKEPPAIIALTKEGYPHLRLGIRAILGNQRFSNFLDSHYQITTDRWNYRIYARIR